MRTHARTHARTYCCATNIQMSLIQLFLFSKQMWESLSNDSPKIKNGFCTYLDTLVLVQNFSTDWTNAVRHPFCKVLPSVQGKRKEKCWILLKQILKDSSWHFLPFPSFSTCIFFYPNTSISIYGCCLDNAFHISLAVEFNRTSKLFSGFTVF